MITGCYNFKNQNSILGITAFVWYLWDSLSVSLYILCDLFPVSLWYLCGVFGVSLQCLCGWKNIGKSLEGNRDGIYEIYELKITGNLIAKYDL